MVKNSIFIATNSISSKNCKMRKFSTYFASLITLAAISIAAPSFAQMVGDQVFLQGAYVEVGVAPNGALGSTRLPPTSPPFHCNSPTFNFYDPGISAFTGASNQRLMMVYDAGHDGWTTGTPGFFGDYSMPGSPYEGWGIQVNGQHSEAQAQYYMGTTTGFAGAASLTGTNVSYTNTGGTMTGVWQGTAGPGGALSITQTTVLDTTASWVRMNVKLKNTGGATLTGIHYLRETDPDNDRMASGGSYVTSNTINYQNDHHHRVMVTATGTHYTSQTLSLSAKDCRAKAFIGRTWPMSVSLNLATLWSSGATWYDFTGSYTGDVAIGMVFNLGDLAPGDSTELSYAYVFNGLLGIDSAIASPQVVVNGIPRDSVDTVTSCSFTGATLAMSVVNGDAADWEGSTWTWAPSTYLSATTGLSTTASVASMTTPITYTITGTTGVSGCAGRTFFITVLPPGATPPPTTTDTVAYCLGETASPLSATGIGTIYWWTTPTGGVGSTTPPTPSTAAVGVTTYYVSQDVAACPSVRIPVTVIVFALSTPITGSNFVCTGYTTALANGTAGGTWTSSNMSVATVDTFTGVVTGVTPGTSMISYHVLGCLATTVVTVTTTPATISGIAIACEGYTTTFSNSVPGGSWSSSNTTIATVGSLTGIVSGNSVGTATITYDMGGGCYTTKVVSVNPIPDPITGSGSVCVGATTALSSTSPGGLWTSSLPGVASVSVISGVVTGMSAGTATISYRVAGCSVTRVVTVVTAATPIVGPPTVCVGSNITLSNATAGGTWTSMSTGIATIGSSSGIVTGMAAGTATIEYVVSAGCSITRVITVVPTPPDITGTMSMCIGGSTTLSHSTAGGTWTASAPGIADVGIATGVVTSTGGAGTSTITYTLPSGCIAVATVTVNAGPSAITGTLSLCQGSTTTLSSATSGGTWSSSASGIASIGSISGIVSGGTSGTATIIYTASTGCTTSAVVTVNTLPATISGPSSVCSGNDITLTDATPSGSWSSSSTATASITSSGVVTGGTAGTATITYALPSGCFVTKVVTVTAGPAPLTGGTGLCVSTTTSLSSTTSGGTWSVIGTAASILSPGLIGGVSAGTATVVYTVAGCSTSTIVTVYAVPSSIGGPDDVCVGSVIICTNSASGGSWSSSSPIIASIDTSTGVLTGNNPGTCTVTYSLGFGCNSTKVITVNPVPAAIGGTFSLCQGSTTTLTSSPGGGTWNSLPTSVATIGVLSGAVTTGSTTGTATITYTLPTGCRSTEILTVNPLPAPVTGGTNVCVGSTITLSSTTPGGTWSASNGNATVGFTTGVVTGVLPGTVIISYTLPSGCYRTTTVLVSGLPTGIGGSLQVCEGGSSTLSGAPSGGTWSSLSTGIATISMGSGVMNGISAGTASIIYTLPTGCSRTSIATVNPLPGAITGTSNVCVGQNTTLSTTSTGGTWSSSTPAIGTINSGGVVTGLANGTTTVSYTLPTGCYTTRTVTVLSLPGVITGNANVCESATTTLNCTPAGGTWSTSAPATATIGLTSGIVSATAASGTAMITYTVGTGCFNTRVVTVNPLPNPITGTTVMCVGNSEILSSTTSGGTWTSVTTATATVGSATGIVSGVNAGTSLISYSLPTGCSVTETVTVNGLPTSITGVLQACVGLTTPLSSTPAGGTWTSSIPGNASVDATTGVVTGVTAGSTATITYQLGTSCYTTAVVSVNTPPLPVTGPADNVCVGQQITLSDASPSGTWTSGDTATATVAPTTGVVTGVAAGTVYISYTIPTGCYQVKMITVHALPTAITGPTEVCEQSSVTLGSTPTGGTWTSSSSLVTVNPTTGEVFGNSDGVATITYTQGIGCQTTSDITINPQPDTITGNLGVCIGLTTMLSTTSTGGTWSSSDTSIAPIDASGTVSGLVVGTADVMYTLPVTGCTRSAQVTVNPLPGPITGSDAFCNFSYTTYLNSTPGGTWSSADTNVIRVENATTGLVYSKNVDTTDIIYTLPTGCSTSKRVYLIVAPLPITGPDRLCVGQHDTLLNGIGGGVWSSTNTSIVPVDPANGTVDGLASGTANITYILSTGCASAHPMTVNPVPSGTGGPQEVCIGLCETLVNITPGGTWSSDDITIATIDSATGVYCGLDGGTTGLTTTIRYSLGSGCNSSVVITVNPLPDDITGTPQVCEGLTTTLYDSYSGGVWSSSNPSLANIDASTGVLSGVFAGTATITYTLPTSCLKTKEVTVNPLPSAISGLTDICVDGSTTLVNPTPGGGWMSSDTSIATVDASGVVTGVAPGNVVISYILPTSCQATFPMTINANPDPVTGSLSVCAGFATNLHSGPAGGYWSAGASGASYGSINSATGVVSGIRAGVIPVTYTLGSGCNATAEVTVITLPAVIGGVPTVCVNDTTVMTNPIAGGIWSISNTRATIDPATGVVVGVSAGTAVVTYSVGTGCFNVHTITVNPLPGVITGPDQVCEDATIRLFTTSTDGTWVSPDTHTATVDAFTGVVSGENAGTVSITYAIGGTGCMRTKPITVNQTPYPIQGNPHICIGSSNTFTDTLPGGIWYSGTPSVGTIGATTGVLTSVSLGTTVISYRLPSTGCQATREVTVQPLPTVFDVTVTDTGKYCAGGIGVDIGLDGSQPGVSYVLYHGSSATGYQSGTGSAISFGLHTAAGVYSVQATNVTSGCKKDMRGTATVIIRPLVTPSVAVGTTPYDSLCPGQPVLITPIAMNEGPTPTYLWKVNGVNVSTTSSYSFVPANGDVVSLVMTGSAECASAPTATASKVLTVLPNEVPVAGVLVTPNDTVCQFNPTTFTANPMYGGTAPTYRWLINGSVVGTGDTYTYVPVNADEVYCEMVSNYRCRLSDTVMSGVVNMSVDSIIIPHVSVYPDPGFVVEEGKPVTLLTSVTGAGPSPKYQWKRNGYDIPGATSDKYTAVFNDYDSISCVVTSSGVCANVGTHGWVFISIAPLASSSTQGMKASDIRLMPNPNRGTFTVKGTLGIAKDAEINADITNMLGQVVYEGVLKAKRGELDTKIEMDKSLANGMYILTLRTEEGQKVFHFVMEQ